MPEDANSEDLDDWLFDYIVNFLRSPPWTVPITDFLDENCTVFDSEEEHQLSHQQVHLNFCELINALLTNALEELGVTGLQFVQACERGQESDSQITKLIFSQILAADDFLIFKKMMVQRSKKLNMQVLEALRDGRLGPGSEAETKPEPEPEPEPVDAPPSPTKDADLRRALQLSKEHHQSQQSQLASSDIEYKRALAVSLAEQEVQSSQYNAEQAELEHVMALSLALEAERLKQAELQKKQEEARLALEAQQLTAAQAEVEQAKVAAASQQQQMKEQLQVAEHARLNAAKESAAAEAEKKAAKVAAAQAKVDKFDLAAAPNLLTPIKTSKNVSLAADTDLVLNNFADSLVIDSAAAAPKAMAKTYQRVNDSFLLNKKAELQTQYEKKKISLTSTKSKTDAAELARRKEFLRSQRQKMIALKKKKGAESLRDWKSKNNGGLMTPPPMIARKVKKTDDAPHWSEAFTQSKQDIMRSALSMRLKKDEVNKVQEGPSLEQNLAKMEALRAERAANEAAARKAAVDQARREHAQFAANLANSAFDANSN